MVKGQQKTVSFVVVNWNGKSVLSDCLDSILRLQYPIKDIIVVDNGSVDGSIEMMQDKYSDKVTVLRNERNLGAPVGRNRGMKYAVENGSDFVFALDNDLTIAPEAIDRLITVLSGDSQIAMAGALIFYEERPDVIFSAGHVINWTQNLVGTLGANQKNAGQFRDIWQVDYVGSGAVLVRTEYMKKHGYFDESYIGYGYEDTEYGYRANNLGYRVVCCADAKVWHKPHSNIGRYSFKKKYLETRNAIRFMKKYGTFLNWSKYLVYVLPGFIYAFFREGFRGNMPGVIGKMRGFYDGIRDYDDLAYKLLNEK
jgi:GT2 family glycosyltransferase